LSRAATAALRALSSSVTFKDSRSRLNISCLDCKKVFSLST
jgi:hypothetical protein